MIRFYFCYSEILLNQVEKLFSCIQYCLFDTQLCVQNSSTKAGLQYYIDRFIMYFMTINIGNLMALRFLRCGSECLEICGITLSKCRVFMKEKLKIRHSL